MLELEIVPGKSLGRFQIGMSISTAIGVVKELNKYIKKADIIYSEEDPLSKDIIIDLSKDGILLRFEVVTQELRTIEIYNVPLNKLTYRGAVVSAPDTPATFALIYSRFGPSFPGDLDSRNYYLNYPGLTMTFPIPDKFKQHYVNASELPLEFPDGTTPTTTRISIYKGTKISDPEQHKSSEVDVAHSEDSAFHQREIVAHIGRGISFTYHAAVTSSVLVGSASSSSMIQPDRLCQLSFKSTPEDVLSELGPPSRLHYKEEDKMQIHSNEEVDEFPAPDYFYNYFSLGLDILFDGVEHTIKKFIFHTNYPCHYDFNRYCKANFKIEVDEDYDPEPVGSSKSNLKLQSGPAKQQQQQQRRAPGKDEDEEDGRFQSAQALRSMKDADPLAQLSNRFVIQPDTKWEEVTNKFGAPGKPVVHNRGYNANPFGPTYFYGYKGAIFETMRNGHIASICLFKYQ